MGSPVANRGRSDGVVKVIKGGVAFICPVWDRESGGEEIMHYNLMLMQLLRAGDTCNVEFSTVRQLIAEGKITWTP